MPVVNTPLELVSPPEMFFFFCDESHCQSPTLERLSDYFLRQLMMKMTLMWIQKIWMEKWSMHYWKCYEVGVMEQFGEAKISIQKLIPYRMCAMIEMKFD